MKKKYNFLFILLFAAATISSCKKDSGDGAEEVEPTVTPVGTADGASVTQNIGSAGGTIVSEDGEIELIIPSGALPGNTDITIQPITNNAPNGRGKAYRCTPDGLQFAKDITIKFHYTEEEAAMTEPEYMQAAYQNADGTWQVIEKVTNNVAGQTVSATVNHFTDFTEFDILRLDPSSLYLKPGETGTFGVSYAGMSTDGRITFALEVLRSDIVWKVNGATGGNASDGTIQPTTRVGAKYTAPAAAPTINPVAIAAEVNIPFVVNGQSFNKGVLTGQAFITGANYGVLIEHELTFFIGTGEKFVMKDRLSFNVHLIGGIQAIVDNLQNSVPTVLKTEESPVGCVTTFTQVGTGQLHASSVDKIGVTVNPIDGEVYIGANGMMTGNINPIIHTACPGVTPGTNELPIAFMGMPSFEFKDSGQSQVIEENVQFIKQKITITPVQ